jgi:hypothetical protein
MNNNLQQTVFLGFQNSETTQYRLELQSFLEQLRPTRHLVGPDGSYDPKLLFTYEEKIKEIKEHVNNLVESHNNLNNDPEIRVLISNIQQIILAYYSLINNTARELNIKIFDMPWDKIISGKIDLTNPQIDSSNPFTVSSITRRTLGGRTKKRRHRKRRTQRRIRRHYK